MTTLRQAAQQALEALDSDNPDIQLRAAVTLRNALKQQAEPVCPECKAAVLYECVACSSNNYPPPQQAEPVAQRPWVELTPEEILDLFDVNNVYGSKWIEFARTVEAALRSKNT